MAEDFLEAASEAEEAVAGSRSILVICGRALARLTRRCTKLLKVVPGLKF